MASFNLYDFSVLSNETLDKIESLLQTRTKGNYVEPTREIIELLNLSNFTAPLLCYQCPTAGKHIDLLVVPFLASRKAQIISETQTENEIKDGESTTQTKKKKKTE